MAIIPLWLAATLASSGVLIASSPKFIDYNLFFMKFFRNLSRSKARARLHNNKFAMIPVMLGIEQPLKIKDDIYAENVMTITRDMLEEMDGYDGAPLYLSIKGRVYDVSAGHKFYSEGKEYHEWVGRDATRSFGTGCRGGKDKLGVECLSESTEGLTEAEMKEIDRWVELYETHDKYTFVGHLVDDPVNDILEQVEDMDNNVEIMEGDEIESDERHNEANQAESLSEEAVEG